MAVCLDEYEVLSCTEDVVVLKHKGDESLVELPAIPEVLQLIEKNCINDSIEVEAESLDVEASTGGKVKWTEDSCRCLIAEYTEHEGDFQSTTKRNEEVWQDISAKMKLRGYGFSSKQVEFKWKHLRRLYLKKKENMGSKDTGARPIVFKLYAEMDAIYSKKHAVNPVAIASSSKGSQLNPDVINASFNAQSVEPQKRREDSSSTSPTKSKKSKITNELIGWLDANNKKREEVQQERHNEVLKVQKDAVNAFTDVMTRLIEKM